ncbi:PKD domain-containing protein [Lacibacter sp. H407]|uniref:PKD domain-containing protein n=1 Tax=Lacibacter sp. H407 TaxID=3133423 RepID=UPI0030C187A2
MKQALFAILFVIIIAAIAVSCKKKYSCLECNSIITNKPPVACAGNDQTTTLPVNMVLLDGSCSTDPDSKIVSYLWTKIAGPSSYNITNPTIVQTQVNNLAEGTFLFQLKITDAGGLSSMDTIQIIVNKQIDTPQVNIYISGDDNGMPVYWRNGQVVRLGSLTNSIARSIALVGNDVYVVGDQSDMNPYSKVKYWKNGQEVLLPEPVGSSANSIAIEGNDVYIAGWQWSGSKFVAMYWKNGQPIALTNGLTNAEATSITVVGANVYVAGQENGVAKYWKNFQPVTLTDGSQQAYANSIAVVGNDVYVAGSESNGTAHVAKYWKNGQAVSLTNGTAVHAVANSIVVIGNDVYVAGWEGDFLGRVGGTGSVAKYWKNGQAVSLTNGTTYSYATSLAVDGSDVYVAGYEGSTSLSAKYWKNGQAISLTGTNASLATGILVVPR